MKRIKNNNVETTIRIRDPLGFRAFTVLRFTLILPGVDAELHLGDLLVDLLHEVNDEVDQLVTVHLVRVEIGDQETENKQ